MKKFRHTFVWIQCFFLLETGLGTVSLYGQYYSESPNSKYCLDTEVIYNLNFACGSGSLDHEPMVYYQGAPYSAYLKQYAYHGYSNYIDTVRSKLYFPDRITYLSLSHISYSSGCYVSPNNCLPQPYVDLDPNDYFYDLRYYLSQQIYCRISSDDKNYITARKFSFYPLLRLKQESEYMDYDGDIVLTLTGIYGMLDFFKPEDVLNFRFTLGSLPNFNRETWLSEGRTVRYTVEATDDREIRIPANEFFRNRAEYESYINNNLFLHLDFGVWDNYVFTYTIKPSLPKVTEWQVIPAPCADSDGSIKLTFNRNLDSGESLQLFWQREHGKIVSNFQSEGGKWTYVYDNIPVGKDTLWVAGGNAVFSATGVTQVIPGIEITAPDSLLYKITSLTDSVCYGSTGSVTFQIQGGTKPYTLHWKKETGNEQLYSGIHTNSYVLSNLEKGIYSYYITDKNGCRSEKDRSGNLEDIEIKAPDDLITIQITDTVMPAVYGGNGNFKFEVSGGWGDYDVSYRYDNADSTHVEMTVGLYQINGKGGTYVIKVYDKIKCIQTKSFILTQPDTLRITINRTEAIPCAGEYTGALEAVVTGGVQPYTYEWQYKKNAADSPVNAGYTQEITGLESGIYQVIVRDDAGSGMPKSKEYTLTEPDSLKISDMSVRNVTCTSSNTGIVRFRISGGTGNYTVHYKMKTETNYRDMLVRRTSSRLNLTALSAGIYEFYIMDENNCELILDDIEITEPDELLSLAEVGRFEAGYGKSDGFIRVSIEGGVPPYSVVWQNASNNTVSTVVNTTVAGVFRTEAYNLPKATYTLSVTDAASCNKSLTLVLDDRQQLALTTEKTDILCNGDSGGQIIVHAVGGLRKSGNKPYSYSWYKYDDTVPVLAANETDSILSDLAAGRYQVQVRDSLNETISSMITLMQPGVLKATAAASKNISCFGGNDGTITVHIDGGTAPYSVFYQNTETETTYRSTISGDSVPDLVISNLNKGIYNFYITDKNSCAGQINLSDTAVVALTQPAKALSITSERIYGTTASGLSNGRIVVDLEGGTPPYSVEWKNGAGTILPAAQTAEGNGIRTTINNLPTGNYTLTVKDVNYNGTSNACFLSQTYTLTQIAPLEVSLATVPVDCYGNATGKVIAYAKNGLPFETGRPYRYTWYRVEGSTETLLNNQNDSLLANIPIGMYKVKVEDAAIPVNTAMAVVEITQPTLLSTQLTTKNISCFDGNDGEIQVTVAGGTGMYQLFYRKTGTDTAYQPVTWNAEKQAFKLASLFSGYYQVYAKDSNGCIAPVNGNDTALIVLTQPMQPLHIALDTLTNVSGHKLSNGKISVIVEGGTPPYFITWKDGKNNAVASNETTAGGQTTTSLSGLVAGNYTLTIKDANYYAEETSCLLHRTYTVSQPDSLTVSLTSMLTHIPCYGDSTGNITAHAAGGVKNAAGLPYHYQWTKIENDTETVLTTADSTLTGLPAGKYKVVITDNSYLPNTVASEVFEITRSALLETTVFTRRVSCYQGNDAFIKIRITGGLRPYTCFYKQNGVDGDYRTLILGTSDASDTFVMDQLTAGDYSIFILDDYNCSALIDGKATASIRIEQPAQALRIARTGSVNPSGYGRSDGELFVEVTGGTAPYIVRWKDAKGNDLTGEDNSDTGVFRNTLSNRPVGSYSVVVYDSYYADAMPETNSTCLDGATFTLSQPDSLRVSIAETHFVSCNGMSDGVLAVTASGGVPGAGGTPYQYQWSVLNGSNYVPLSGQTRDRLENIPAGSYRVQVTDYSRTPNITACDYVQVQPETLTAAATQKEIACGETATLSVTVAGGTPPYRYYWSTGETTPSVASVGAGKYFVIVHDSRGCETTALANIQSPSDLKITESLAYPVCYGVSNGSITVQVNGGKPPYSYQWNNGSRSKNLENVPAGFYTLTVSDAAGCSYTGSFELADPPALQVDLSEDRILCANQEARLIPTVSDPNVRYSWTGPDNFRSADSQISVRTAGTYLLTVTNASGCQASGQVNVQVNDLIISSEIVVSSQVFVGDTVVIVNISHPQPDNVEWLLSVSDSMIVTEKAEHLAKVVFEAPGLYTIGIRTRAGDCYQDLLKTVTAVPASERNNDTFGESSVTKFTIAPNPNNGNFTVDVELSREAAIRLRIVNVGNGYTFNDKVYESKQVFSIPYMLVLPAGIYAVLIETASGYVHVKMIIN